MRCVQCAIRLHGYELCSEACVKSLVASYALEGGMCSPTCVRMGTFGFPVPVRRADPFGTMSEQLLVIRPTFPFVAGTMHKNNCVQCAKKVRAGASNHVLCSRRCRKSLMAQYALEGWRLMQTEDPSRSVTWISGTLDALGRTPFKHERRIGRSPRQGGPAYFTVSYQHGVLHEVDEALGLEDLHA